MTSKALNACGTWLDKASMLNLAGGPGPKGLQNVIPQYYKGLPTAGQVTIVVNVGEGEEYALLLTLCKINS